MRHRAGPNRAMFVGFCLLCILLCFDGLAVEGETKIVQEDSYVGRVFNYLWWNVRPELDLDAYVNYLKSNDLWYSVEHTTAPSLPDDMAIWDTAYTYDVTGSVAVYTGTWANISNDWDWNDGEYYQARLVRNGSVVGTTAPTTSDNQLLRLDYSGVRPGDSLVFQLLTHDVSYSLWPWGETECIGYSPYKPVTGGTGQLWFRASSSGHEIADATSGYILTSDYDQLTSCEISFEVLERKSWAKYPDAPCPAYLANPLQVYVNGNPVCGVSSLGWHTYNVPLSYLSGGGAFEVAFGIDDSGFVNIGYEVGKTKVRITLVGSHEVTSPSTPAGPSSGECSGTLSYNTGSASCSEGHPVEYQFDWGDGTYSGWSATTSTDHFYGSSDTYTITAQARCSEDETVDSNLSGELAVTITCAGESVSFDSPASPTGPSSGECGDTLAYSTGSASCSAGHEVEYRFNWRDGEYSDWSATATAPHVYGFAETYTVRAQARCSVNRQRVSSLSPGLTVDITCAQGETVNSPTTPVGPPSGECGGSLGYGTGSASCSEGHPVEYRFDWGDGEYSPWAAAVSAAHVYSSGGTYAVRAQARCSVNDLVISNPSSELHVEVACDGESVSAPASPSGPVAGELGEIFAYSTGDAACSAGHAVEYRFEWGDGTYSTWSTMPGSSYAYSSAGAYAIRAQARCAVNNAVVSGFSPGTTLSVSENASPTATFYYSPNRGAVCGDTIKFYGRKSSDPNGDALEHVWFFGDGTTGYGTSVDHVYLDSGVYNVTLTVSDPSGVAGTTTKSITVESLTASLVFHSIEGSPAEAKITLENTGRAAWSGTGSLKAGLSYHEGWIPDSQTLFYSVSLGRISLDPREKTTLTVSLPGIPTDKMQIFQDALHYSYGAAADSDPDHDYIGITVNVTSGGAHKRSYGWIPLAPPPGSPRIESITPALRCLFLSGVPAWNEHTVTVNWDGLQPSQLRYVLNGETVESQLGPTDVEQLGFAIDMGSLLPFPSVNTLHVSVAGEDLNGNVVWSDQAEVDLSQASVVLPSWLGDYIDDIPGLAISDNDGLLTYSFTHEFDVPLPSKWEFEILPGIPVISPILGGKYSFEVTQEPLISASLSCGEAAAEMAFGLKFMKSKGEWDVGFGFDGFGSLSLDPMRNLALNNGYLEVGLFGSATKNWKVSSLIPQLAALESLPIFGPYFEDFFSTVQVVTGLAASANGKATFTEGDPGNIPGMPGIDVSGSVVLGITGTIGLIGNFHECFSFSLIGSFEPRLYIDFPGAQGELFEISGFEVLGSISGDVSITVSAWVISKSYSHHFEIDLYHRFFSPPEGIAQLPEAVEWRIETRPYDAPGYNTFVGEDRIENEIRVSDSLVISQPFPQARPRIASSGDLTILAWVADDTTQPVPRGTGLYYSIRSGAGGWSPPNPVAVNDNPEGEPTLAVDREGNFVIAWSQHRRPDLPEDVAFDKELLSGIEIVFAVFDADRKEWSAAQSITQNTVLDHSPDLVSDNAGDMFLVWIRNEANDILPLQGSPDTVLAAAWDGTEFASPIAVRTDDHALRRSFAANRDQLLYVYQEKDETGDLGVFASVLEKGFPGETVQLTEITESSDIVCALFTETGPVVAWVEPTQTGSLVSVVEVNLNARKALTAVVGVVLTDLEIYDTSDGTIRAIATTLSPLAGERFALAEFAFDDRVSSFAEITLQDADVTSISVSLGSYGIQVAYLMNPVRLTTRSVSYSVPDSARPGEELSVDVEIPTATLGELELRLLKLEDPTSTLRLVREKLEATTAD